MKKIILLFISYLVLISCSETYAEGEETGIITEFKEVGLFWKSWEGNITVGNKSFDFSVDNDLDKKKAAKLIEQLKKSYSEKTKITLIYHEVFGKNLFHNRGFTDCFVDSIKTEKQENQKKPMKNKVKK